MVSIDDVRPVENAPYRPVQTVFWILNSELGFSPLPSSRLVLLDRITELVFFRAVEDLEVLRVEVEAELKI